MGATAGVMGGKRPVMDAFGQGHFSPCAEIAIVLSTKTCCHRSHFGSRYKLGCCGHAGLFENASRAAISFKTQVSPFEAQGLSLSFSLSLSLSLSLFQDTKSLLHHSKEALLERYDFSAMRLVALRLSW